MNEHFNIGINRQHGDFINYGGSHFANSSNFGIYGGNFINAQDSSNIIIQSHDPIQEIRDWLKAPDCSTNFNTAANKKTAGTGMWIIKHPKYIQWNNNGGLLWIQGKAGSGKTVISTTIISHLRDAVNTVCFHYFDFRDNTGSKSGYQGFLLNMLQQMAVNLQGIDPELQNLYSQCNRGYQVDQPQNSQLEDTLNRIIQESNPEYIVVDALDECNLKDISNVVKWVANISARVKTLVTSRYSPEDQAADIGLIIGLDSEGSKIEEDISLYLEDQVHPHFKGELKAKVLDALKDKAQGQFRWVDCQVRTLFQCPNEKAVIRTLPKLPRDLQETYMQAIQRAKQSEYAADAHNLLMWLTFAFEPLNKRQVADFLAIDLETWELYPSDGMTLKVELVIDSNLVTVDTNNIVQLAHNSVKEFLITKAHLDQTRGLFKINAQLAHASLAKACIIYLLKSMNEIINTSFISSESETYSYAAKYWQAHTRPVQESGPEKELDNLTKEFLKNGSEPFQAWVRTLQIGFWAEMSDPLYWAVRGSLKRSVNDLILSGECDINANGPYGHALYVAVSQRNEDIVKLLLAHGANVNAVGGYYGNALQAAGFNGNKAIVQLLVTHGADVNAPGRAYGNALQAAVAQGHEAIVQLLLTLGADVNALGGVCEHAVYVAVSQGNKVIVKLLLDHGADVNARGGHYGNALQAAASSGDEAIVKLLLASGVNVNAIGGFYGNALQAAVFNGNEAIIQLLLSNGADVNAQGGEYGNALLAAVSSENEGIVQLLLKNGADVNAQGDYYGNVLLAAVSNGNEVTVQLLLNNGADVNAQGGYYGNALLEAVSDGNEAIVQLLLKNGADVNAQEDYYGNALLAAASRGNEVIVQLLLNNGADVNVYSVNYGYALQVAASKANEVIVQLLLTNGADVNAHSVNCGSALQVATSKANEIIVQVLLTNGADVNAQGGYYGNALQAAAGHGNEAIVQLLLTNGANVNAQGGRYGNALQAAASNEYQAIVQLLLMNGANVNAQGGFFENALYAAVCNGNALQSTMFDENQVIVQLLLTHGADVNAQGGYYGNSLQAAASIRTEAVVQLLLTNGADVNAQGGYYGNALQAAAYTGNKTIVQLLLTNGADVNAQGGEHENALQAAASNGNEAIVQLLLTSGANMNAAKAHLVT